MEAGKRNITDIFNRSRILKIPHFQRSYVWKEDYWERFLEDMTYVSKTNNTYFMGSIILKQQETSSEFQTGDVRTVIDGQQRLTTTLLFFKALFIRNEESERFSTTFETFNNELILEHNFSDKPIFDKILLDQEILEEDKNKQIWKCYNYFLENIVKNEIKPNNLLSRVLFVGIDLQNQEDEQQIFDTINSLGVSLTTAELLKNYLFKDDINSYNINWRDIFEKDDEIKNYWEQEVTSGRSIRNNIDLFLQSYLFIKIQEKDLKVSSEDKERFFKIDSVFNSYKEFIKNYNLNINDIIKELKEYASIYKKNIIPQITEQDLNKNNYIQRLNLIIFGLDTATIIPYVLYISKKVQNESDMFEIFKYVETYLMRRIICRATTKNYNQLFRSALINNEIDTLSKLKEFIENKSEKINYIPTDEDVKKGVNESWLSNKQTRAILYFIERTIRNDLYSTELKFISEYSLEHIMPKKWRNNWDKDNKLSEPEKKERDRIILTLGNLTIITKQLNSSIRDSDWTTKKIGSGKNKGLNEYAQGIEIFSKYMQKENWDEICIKERAEELYNYSVNHVWNLK